MQKFFVVVFALLVCVTGFAQKRMQSVVYLKNGSILRGELINPESSGKVSIKITGNNVFVFDLSEVEKITTESSATKLEYKKHGYSHSSEFGFLIGGEGDGIGLGLQTINGYKFNPYAALGAGVGVQFYWNLPINYYWYYAETNTTRLIPIFVNFSGDLLPSKPITPHYFARAGYAFASNNNEFLKTEGGLTFGLGAGFKLRGQGPLSWVLGVGYNFQKFSTEYVPFEGNVTRTELDIRRLSIFTGISF
ncbi:MAG: hypothetical protein IPM47_15935 [Sphingobacteriales bacterium]|nr:MAG: hypothetical protein IPM47_15935 [Sphingobacteriales bacterium]